MGVRFSMPTSVGVMLFSLLFITATAPQASAQSWRDRWCPPPCPCPTPLPTVPTQPSIGQPSTGQPPSTTPSTETPTTPTESPLSAEQAAASEAGTFAAATPTMLGDQLGIPGIGFLPPGTVITGQGIARTAVALPSVRGFQISEDESPRPLDRVYFGFNYFDDINRSINDVLNVNIHEIRVYRETFGLEKTFLDGNVSVGLRLPLNTLSSESTIPGFNGSNTDVGDLTVILKGVILEDRKSGDLLSGGLAITTPTGPNAFAGSPVISTFHDTILQPYVGFIYNIDSWFIHGFSSVAVPTDPNDVTLFFNDIGVGYYLYRSGSCGNLVSAVIPTFEVHVNTPLNHRGALNIQDQAATPDWVDLTMGTTVEFNKHATFALAFVTPVTGPKPYEFEVMAQLNIRFGGPRQ